VFHVARNTQRRKTISAEIKSKTKSEMLHSKYTDLALKGRGKTKLIPASESPPLSEIFCSKA